MSTTQPGSDPILFNGQVLTADPACRYAQAMSSGSQFSAVGTNNEITATAHAHT